MEGSARRSGLGRGLAALIPAAEGDADEPPARSPRLDALLADAIAAGLDAVQAVVALDLCAYLHLPAGEGARLHLRAPTMTSLEATAAFQLFTDISAAAEANGGDHHPVILGPYTALGWRAAAPSPGACTPSAASGARSRRTRSPS